jgi:tRNA-2-methylthio-N6-dimethylallyladenosine synthase
MNSAESAALDRVIRERGWTPAERGDEADLVLLNTCSVRETAERRVLGRIAQYGALKKKRRKSGRPLTLIIAGCMAERLGEKLREEYPADFVMGIGSRPLFPGILEAVERGAGGEFSELPALRFPAGPPPESSGVFPFAPLHLEGGGGKTVRSLVPIMHGCNNFCSYCIVPHVRGREVSRRPQEILVELSLLAEAGVREVTLLGQNVNSYRCRSEEAGDITFPALLRMIARSLEGTPLRWVRFLSANPGDFSEETIEVLAEHPVFCRHIHLCVQHGSNRILRRMNRRYTREQYLDLAARIRKALPGVSLSTDILVGFPGETEEDLQLTLDLMEEARFLYAYMYHYNPREGTAAYKLPDRIPEALKRERLSRVISLQKRHSRELLSARLGRRETVLIEGISRKNADEILARTARDEMAAAPGSAEMIGRFGELTLSSLEGNTFRGGDLALEGAPDFAGLPVRPAV